MPISSQRLFALLALSGAASGSWFTQTAHAQSPTPSLCPPVQVVFALDTSNSMLDESRALCATIESVQEELAESGIEASSTIWGLTDASAPGFDCLEGSIIADLESTVPGNPGGCGETLGDQDTESWGPATAILAEHYPWQEGAVRVIVPISDEAACQGNPCNVPGDYAQSVANAIAIAQNNQVIVSPILGTDVSGCAVETAVNLALETGGRVFTSQVPELNLGATITQLVEDACVTALSCQLSPGPQVTPPGEPNQFTIAFQEETLPAVDSRVELRVLAGPHEGQRASGQTNEGGELSLGYTGSIRGVDRLGAVCIDATGREQASANSELQFWDSDCDNNGIADLCDLSCSNFEQDCEVFPNCGQGIDADDNNQLDVCEDVIDPDEVCGNGVVDYCEECDDGNREDGDGCSSDCMLEHKGWPKHPSVEDKLRKLDDKLQSVKDRLKQMSRKVKKRLGDKLKRATSSWRPSRWSSKAP